eukprot:929767_1
MIQMSSIFQGVSSPPLIILIPVTQDPEVEFSYGIEVEHVRWVLGMSNLKVSLKEACQQEIEEQSEEECIRHRRMLAYGHITEAEFFDPIQEPMSGGRINNLNDRQYANACDLMYLN